RDGDEVLGYGLYITAKPGERPLACTVGVSHGLQRGEGLRRHDEQRLGRVEIECCLDKVGAVDVGHESERHIAFAVVTQCFVGHYRAEVGAADPDIDDVTDALTRVSLPLTAADAV